MGNTVILSSLGYYLLSSMMQLSSSLILLLLVLLCHVKAAPSPGDENCSMGEREIGNCDWIVKRMAGYEMAAPSPSNDEKWYSHADSIRDNKDKDKRIKVIDGMKIEFKWSDRMKNKDNDKDNNNNDKL